MLTHSSDVFLALSRRYMLWWFRFTKHKSRSSGRLVVEISCLATGHACHYNDVIMSAMASQITNLTIVFSRCRLKKTPLLLVTGLCEGNSPVTGEFPAQRASNAENVSIWWHHHAMPVLYRNKTTIMGYPCHHRPLIGPAANKPLLHGGAADTKRHLPDDARTRIVTDGTFSVKHDTPGSSKLQMRWPTEFVSRGHYW